MSTNERLLKLATATPAVLAKVDAVLNGGEITTHAPDKDCRLVTYTEAAKRMNVSRPTIYRLVKCGRLRTVPLNGVSRVVLSSIDNVINSGRW